MPQQISFVDDVEAIDVGLELVDGGGERQPVEPAGHRHRPALSSTSSWNHPCPGTTRVLEPPVSRNHPCPQIRSHRITNSSRTATDVLM